MPSVDKDKQYCTHCGRKLPMSEFYSNEVDMEAKYQFDMGDGYTLTVWIDMREYRDYKYYDCDTGYPYTPTLGNTIETYRSIDKVYAECMRDGEGDDDFYEADITNLFDKELRWEVY